jgi:hypothetical protein
MSSHEIQGLLINPLITKGKLSHILSRLLTIGKIYLFSAQNTKTIILKDLG